MRFIFLFLLFEKVKISKFMHLLFHDSRIFLGRIYNLTRGVESSYIVHTSQRWNVQHSKKKVKSTELPSNQSAVTSSKFFEFFPYISFPTSGKCLWANLKIFIFFFSIRKSEKLTKIILLTLSRFSNLLKISNINWLYFLTNYVIKLKKTNNDDKS